MFAFEIRTDIPEFRIINNGQTVDILTQGYSDGFSIESQDSKTTFNGIFEGTDAIIYLYDDKVEYNLVFWSKEVVRDKVTFNFEIDSRARFSIENSILTFVSYSGQEIISLGSFILINDQDEIIQELPMHHSFNSGKHEISIDIPVNEIEEGSTTLRFVLNTPLIASAPSVMSTGPAAFSFVAGEVDPVSRGIYGATPGPILYSIHLFQGLFTNSGVHPDSEKYIVDYPLNLYKGIPITGTVPLDSHISGGTSDIVEAYNLGLGLDTLTLYIEFVANKIVGIDGYAPALFFDVIPPSSTAYYSVNNEADYMGNINGSSVYRGTYTVHKQSAPLYVDGTYKIRLKSKSFETDNLIFKMSRVLGFFMVDVSELGGDAPIAP